MLSLPLLIGLGAFVAAFFLSNRLVRRALEALSDAERSRFVEHVVASRNSTGLIAYVAIVGLWFAGVSTWPAHARTVHLVFLVAVVGLLVAFIVRGHGRTAGMPDAFRRTMLHASLARVAGLLVLMAAVAWPLLRT